MGWFSRSRKSNAESNEKKSKRSSSEKKKKNKKILQNNNNYNSILVNDDRTTTSASSSVNLPVNLSLDLNCELNDVKELPGERDSDCSSAQSLPFHELAAATENFREDRLLGEGGFGRVYKGIIKSTNQVVAVKQLDRSGSQGNREFLIEVLLSSLLHHPNLVNLIRYCADGDQRLLVYEYMPLGSLSEHLHDLSLDKRPLDWNTRMKIASGVANGLEYLHEKVKPPVIYRDLKSSNVLLAEDYHPKLSDFGLAKLGPIGDNSHVTTRVMGTYGYCAPEYSKTGLLTLKSDIYSFGVVLLEILTGRTALIYSDSSRKQSLVHWARPFFKDRRTFTQLPDQLLQRQYPRRGLYQAIAIAAMCVQDDPDMRPPITDVVKALSFLASQKYQIVQKTEDTNKLLHTGDSGSEGERDIQEIN
ncbi:hypothetical protein Scep_015704 [Stephania cephalantha]|uniref:Protein kinase domain-containing protein n=1 Tax=Stephania cephalantha TaxID=152367 RepID=A0AAP0J5M6_9MAGN